MITINDLWQKYLNVLSHVTLPVKEMPWKTPHYFRVDMKKKIEIKIKDNNIKSYDLKVIDSWLDSLL